jgi:hypothetical protein
MLNVVGIMVGPHIRSARLRSSRFATWAESLTAASSGGGRGFWAARPEIATSEPEGERHV